MLMKLCLKKGTPYYNELYNSNGIAHKDYWTTIKANEEELSKFSTYYFKSQAKTNIAKQIAINEWNDIRLWKYIQLETCDLEMAK